MTRDWLSVGSKDEVNRVGRVLKKTPWEIAVIVAHRQISYGTSIEQCDREGYVLKALKRTIFLAVKDTIAEHSS